MGPELLQSPECRIVSPQQASPLIQINGYSSRRTRWIAPSQRKNLLEPSRKTLPCNALLGFIVAEHAVERPHPGAAIGFLSQPLSPQQVAQLPVRTDNAERDMA